MSYVPRTLVAFKGSKDERCIDETGIAALGKVVILLGEPGIGKTELTKHISTSLGARRVAAGTFCRTSDASKFATNHTPLIIDGLDEIAASGTETPIDRVLRSLNDLENPNVIITCRAADWNGATNRAKILDDYGVSPVPVHILPFNREQAAAFLKALDDRIDCEELLPAIGAQDLDDLVGNPLTLKLLAEVWLEDEGLPSTRSELLSRATELLTREDNERHDQSAQALISQSDHLDAAGAVFAHLLLAGAVGIETNSRRNSTEGFVPFAELNTIKTAVDIDTVLKTRLFKSDGEDLLVPVHRVVAEYLAARWLSKKLDERLSVRRLFQLLLFNGGIPSGLRGLHAWLGYFSPQVRKRCIDVDPYGFLRYGDTSALDFHSARHLLKALTKLADEDPYFRSEDWSIRSIAGLARPELKSEIIAVITRPQRHVHLSALLLESLAGSLLTEQVIPELLSLVGDASAVYVERRKAADALIKTSISLNWQEIIQTLLAQTRHDSRRLAVEIIGALGPTKFNAKTVARALIVVNGLNGSERREARIIEIDHRLINSTPPELAKSILDEIAATIDSRPRSNSWHPGQSMTSVIERLLSLAIQDSPIDPRRFWSWIRHLDGRFNNCQDKRLDDVRYYLSANVALRREIQRIVLNDDTVSGGPWMAIMHELPRAVPGLSISIEDAAFFLEEIGRMNSPTAHQIQLWRDLLHASLPAGTMPGELKAAIKTGLQLHPEFAAILKEIENRPSRDYASDEKQRQERFKAKRIKQFQKNRADFLRDLPRIRSGEHVGALKALADGYLGHYYDLDNNAGPYARLVEWVGEEIANAACEGFVARLMRNDLPNLEKIWSIRAERKVWTIEPVMLAGVAEIVRLGGSLADVPESTVAAVLGIWWDMPEFHSTKLGEDIVNALEGRVFRDEERTKSFIKTTIDTQLASCKPNISGFYRIVSDKKFYDFLPNIALKWLVDYPQAPFDIQLQLLRFLLLRGEKEELFNLVSVRVSSNGNLDHDIQQLWTAASFCFAPDFLRSKFPDANLMPKELIWDIKSIVMPDWSEGETLHLPANRYEAIVENFAPKWPIVEPPSSSWGNENPWEACEFVSRCITMIGADRSVAGSVSLDRLIKKLSNTNYLSLVKHVAQEQKRNRRDHEYCVPTIDAVKKVLANAEPSTVDDLKALILDHLFDLQKSVRDSDTGDWRTFWENGRPNNENYCRDRLLTLLRPRLGRGVELFPELPMPDDNRVDIYASILDQGLPIEIKGQWHSEVWNASRTQLDEKYTKDRRADGRGIYLVLWFGEVMGKNLPARPDGKKASSPDDLQQMLMADLSEAQRTRVDVVVFDVSIPTKFKERSAKKPLTNKRVNRIPRQ